MLQRFADNKIIVAKEEGGTSATNQVYDQEQAKSDKRAARELLDIARQSVAGKIGQWQLVLVIFVGIHHLDPNIWERSFIKANLHIHHCVLFDQWIGKIAEKIKTGETYKRTNENHYYDAVSACWKKMKIEDRRKVLDIIDGFENTTDDDTFGWSEENVHKLLPFVNLQIFPNFVFVIRLPERQMLLLWVVTEILFLLMKMKMSLLMLMQMKL